ncbi:hypothetical protein P8452_20798 [Trifolium repens]|nr:hypothetical protein P8452_20798 [Trifolium repens]
MISNIDDFWVDDLHTKIEGTKQLYKQIWEEPKPGMSEIKKSTAVVRLMDFIQEDQHPDLQVEAVKVLGIIANMTNQHAQELTKLDILTRFHKLLRNQNTGRKVIIEVCLAVSTMALRRKTQLKQLIEKKLIGKIICWYATSKDLAIKEAAAHAITNIVDRSYNKKQIKLLVEEECIESLCDMLKSYVGDIGKVIMALKKIQRASTDYNTRILSLAGREIFGSLIHTKEQNLF